MARLPNFLVIIRSEKLSGKGQGRGGRGAKKRTFRFGKKNVSFPKVETFRFADYSFIGILGDFKDHAGFGEELTVEEKRYYIKKSLACLEQLHMRHPQCYKIVVTTDSPYFLKLVKSLSYVYVIPGRLEHMDYAVVDDYEVHLKTFLDFMIITKAEKSYSYQYGKMYGATKFALTAALIGNNEYEVVKD